MQFATHAKWKTEQFIIVDTKKLLARNLVEPMRKAFVQELRRDGGNLFKKHAQEYSFTFSAPWFVGHDRFYVSTYAEIEYLQISKLQVSAYAGMGAFNCDLTFDYNFESNQVTLEKSSVSGPDATESSDRALNRVYRSLIGLLQAADREALVQEERRWIAERDAAKGSQAKEKLVRARIEELTQRRDNRVQQLDAAQNQ